jgi:hypothetical protein
MSWKAHRPYTAIATAPLQVRFLSNAIPNIPDYVSRPEINTFQYQKVISDEFIYSTTKAKNKAWPVDNRGASVLGETRQLRDKLMQVISFGLGYKRNIL